MAISWMQKHKKWLVITIWVSTIAFVGAGFVGWGSYNYNRSGGTIAVVGDEEVLIDDLQREYSNLYNQYQQMFGSAFNNEMAQKLKLEELAFNNVVQKFLLLNLAKEYGLTATKEEVAKELLTIQTFQKDGKFDKNRYLEVLAQNRTNPSEFEDKIKQELIIKKLISIFTTPTSETTIKNLNKLFFAEDKISINIINASDFKIDYSDDDLKKFYEKNKENYKSTTKYVVNIAKIPIEDDEKKSKKAALKKYLNLKKGKENFTQKDILDNTTTYIASEDLEKIFSAKDGDILKPIKTKDNYIVVQLEKKILPKVLPFEKVKEQLKKDYVAQITKKKLLEKKDMLVKNFSGKEIGYVSKEKLPSIEGLNEAEVNLLVQSVFSSNSVINFVNLEDKIVVYKILDTKLAQYDVSKNSLITDNISQLKDNEILSSLIKALQFKYEVKSYMQEK